MAETEIAPGAVLGAERYSLARWLGSGGMASVWLATDELLTRHVAVKVMADTLAFDGRYRARFAREARAAASVSHPSIVPIYDYGLHGERPFLVMEYVSGGSLADVLAGRAAVLPDPCELACELLGALDCVHGAGLVHRDVKPANILLDSTGHARLTDFGIAQPEDSTSLTQTGMVIGSIRYLAPEVAAGGRATVAADLYAAGVVLRELTARTPAPRLAGLIAALTELTPEGRPVSATAALDLISTGPQAAPTPTPAPTPAPAPTERTRVAPARTASGAAVHRRAARPDAHRRRDRPGSANEADRPGSGNDLPGPANEPPRSANDPGAGAGASLAIHVSSRTVALAAAALLVLVVAVILSAPGGGSPPPAKAAAPTVGPAAASTRLADQLSSLEKVVAHAAGR